MSVLRDSLPPAKRVGKTANLIIFLGILYAGLNLAAAFGAIGLASRGYGGPWGFVFAAACLGLGYSIRFGSKAALYATTGLFACMVVWTAGSLLTGVSPRLVVRIGLATLALVALLRSLPAMAELKRRGLRPDRANKYLAFVLATLSRTNRQASRR